MDIEVAGHAVHAPALIAQVVAQAQQDIALGLEARRLVVEGLGLDVEAAAFAEYQAVLLVEQVALQT
ncbi:hypothetical protein D3C77_667220 [compost metagenome]